MLRSRIHPCPSRIIPRRPRRFFRCRVGKRLDYRTAGVDIDAGTELVRRIRKLNPDIGGFNGLVPFGTFFHPFRKKKSSKAIIISLLERMELERN